MTFKENYRKPKKSKQYQTINKSEKNHWEQQRNIQNLRTAKEINKKTRSTKIINKIQNTSERIYENQLS